MFSNGQAVRMENYVNSNLDELVANAANVCGESDGGGDGGDNGGGDDGGDNDDESDCQSPTDATVTEITETTALFSWTDIPDVLKYRLVYKIKGTSTWTQRNLMSSS